MRISELAKLGKVPIQTVRFYERKRLLPPPARTSSGYRSYTKTDLERLQFIKSCQQLGFTLNDIGELLLIHNNGRTASGGNLARNGEWTRAVGLAEERLALLDKKLAELAQLREQLAGVMQVARSRNLEVCPAAAHLGRGGATGPRLSPKRARSTRH